MSDLKAIVIQMGARRAYELARMLHERDALVALQTSAAWASESRPLIRSVLPSLAGAIQRRTVEGLPPEKLRSSMLPEAAGALVNLFGARSDVRFAAQDWVLGAISRARGLSNANVVLTTMGNGGFKFLSWAKRNGAKIATDIFITPLADEIEAAEQCRFPGWEISQVTGGLVTTNRRYITQLVELSDLLICPSENVVDGLRQIPTYDSSKLALIPYGLGDVEIEAGEPRLRTVLFAGTVNLRKGIPYLAQAASILRPHGYDIRVAGPVSPSIRARSECKSLSFLGKLSRAQIASEFKQADVFCLPSLAEGMASVSLEALARGVPCVVTRSAGAPVRHGIDGLIVPERDADGLADGIRYICENRGVRASMSRHALETARLHSIGAVGEKLYRKLRELVDPT